MAGLMMSFRTTLCTALVVAMVCGAAVVQKSTVEDTPGGSIHSPGEKKQIQSIQTINSGQKDGTSSLQLSKETNLRKTNYVCPKSCTCSKNFKNINCKGKRLPKVPNDIPASATVLYLSENLITKIRKTDFEHLQNLTELALNNNEIQTIENGSFINLGKVKRLYLTKNLLTQVGKETFQGLTSLERLYLSQNQLITIPDLCCLVSLKRLIIDVNKLNSTSFPESYKSLKNLTTVSLSDNANVHRLNRDDFQAFVGGVISKIDVSRCGLTHIDNGTFSDLKSLKSLVLSYNELDVKDVDNVLAGISGSSITALQLSGMFKNSEITETTFKPLENVPLEQLFLSNSKNIGEIPTGTFQYFPKLTYLKFDTSFVTDFNSGAFQNMNKLERLDIHGNKLQSVPEGLPPNLKNLDLSENSIQTLADISFSLDELITLDLSNCKLHEIENNAFVGLSKLQTLKLNDNKLGGARIGYKLFYSVPNLISLSLQRNKIRIITAKDSFSPLVNLEALDMSYNHWNSTPYEIFQPLKQLKNLTLTGNDLGGIITLDSGSELFSKNQALERIYLDSSNITSLPKNIFKDLKKLKLISAKNNPLMHWESGAFSGTDLSLLDLSNNQISLVNETSVEGLKNGTRLDLSNNPFACDCDLGWFRNWINTTGVILVKLGSYKCHSPQKMEGKPILSLDTSSSWFKFKCYWLYISIAICGGFVVVVVIVTTVVYKSRWKLKVWWYLRKRNKRSSASGGYERISGTDYKFHGFISACNENKHWVETKLLEELGPATERNMNSEAGEERFNLYWRDQDPDNAGRSTVQIAGEGIEASQKVIIVASSDYFKDKRYCEFELTLAYELKQNDVIFVLLDSKESTIANIPKYMKSKIQNEDLKWEDHDDDKQKVFWACLREELNRDSTIN